MKTPAAGMSYMSNDEVLSLGIYVIDDRSGELIVPASLKTRP
jgi:hypothetical protein